MTQTLTDLLGTNATSSGTTVTIDLSDMKDANGVAYLASPGTASAAKKVAAILAGIHVKTKASVDANGLTVADKTQTIVAEESFSPKSFEKS
jgi:hypothetical protein